MQKRHSEPPRGNAALVGWLLATTSLIALPLGAATKAQACYSGPFSGGYTNNGATPCIAVSNTSFTGNLVNSGTGTISPGAPPPLTGTGILVNNGTITGQISNAGTISANRGIFLANSAAVSGGISNSGTISAADLGIDVISATFSGGISNRGTISAGDAGILVGPILGTGTVPNFAGGITNSGTIKAGTSGILIINQATFAGGITNSGTILSGKTGIAVGLGRFGKNPTFFSGGITNSGTIEASEIGIFVSPTTFSGGITNSGTIISAKSNGIFVFSSTSTFSGGITNSGTVSVVDGIVVASQTFSGGVTNSGTIVGSDRGIVDAAATFLGGVTNSGIIATAHTGIFLVGGHQSFPSGTINAGISFSGGIFNSGTITANSAGINVFQISTFSGGITNSGTIVAKTGIVVGSSALTFLGAITNSGTISGTGGTAIDVSAANNAITINQTGGLISGAVKLSAFADQLNISGGTINGSIIGQGLDNITFAMGAGSFTYGAAYGFSGINEVNVNSGTVILNGTNSATSIAVNNTGTLGGTGTLNSNVSVFSGATLAPGTPGVAGTLMTITGNLGFQSGALYVVALNGTSASRVDVGGTATLAGTVEAVLLPGSYSKNESYTILQAAGGVNGSFSAFSNPGFSGTLTDPPGNLYLTLTSAHLGAGTSLAANPQNVATALNNFFNSGGTLTGGFGPLFGLTGGDLSGALSQLSGEVAADAERGAFAMTTEFLNLMLDPFVDGRFGGTGIGGIGGRAIGFAPDEQSSLPPDVALAYAGVLKAPVPSFDQRWTAWGASFGGSTSSNGDAAVGSNNLSAQTYGFAAGMDYHYSPDTIFGFALGGGGTDWGLANGLGSGRSDAFMAGTYGISWFGPAYVAGALSFANHWFTTNRGVLGDALTATFTGQSYGARVESGWRYAVLPVLGVTPYAALQAQDFHTPSYNEADLTGGGFGLSYAAMNATDVRSELGGRLDSPEVIAGMPLLLRARLAWAHDFVSDPSLSAAFESLPGTNFIVNGAPIPHDSALTSAGAEIFFTPRWTLLVKFDGEFASGSQTYAGSGTLRYTW